MKSKRPVKKYEELPGSEGPTEKDTGTLGSDGQDARINTHPHPSDITVGDKEKKTTMWSRLFGKNTQHQPLSTGDSDDEPSNSNHGPG